MRVFKAAAYINFPRQNVQAVDFCIQIDAMECRSAVKARDAHAAGMDIVRPSKPLHAAASLPAGD